MSFASINDLIGCKFACHGRNKETGFDCYGLAIEVLKRNGIELKDYLYSSKDKRSDVYKDVYNFIHTEKLQKPVELCIIVIAVNGEPNHIGVYIGDDRMIHATENKGVVVEPIRRYAKRIVGFYKVSNC